MDKETLEEAADNWVNKPIIGTKRESFIAGAKWKQEKMYSEEEVYNLLEEAMKDCYDEELEYHYDGDYKNLKKWFEQFKKK